MEDRNIILISLDEVRPDHLGCYGYKKINTPNIDLVAGKGTLFRTCISSADFTPVAMGTVITGRYPYKHGMRNPYCSITGPSIGGYLKEHGYTTAGFVGNGLLADRHGYRTGFDHWDETSKEKSWMELVYPGGESDEMFYEGNYWVDEMFKWLRENSEKKFFAWGHLYETHEGSENALLRKGLIREGEDSEFSYYDAKIRMADKNLIGGLLEILQELKILEKTTLVIMSDHGTNLGEHDAKNIPWRGGRLKYPQHTTMYDHDLKVALMIMGEGIPSGKIVEKGFVRSVDVTPTLLDLAGVPLEGLGLDGKSLVPVMEAGKSDITEVYSEDVFEARGYGMLQSLRTEQNKFIRNLTLGTEEYYDLKMDPEEKKNILSEQDPEEITAMRKKLNHYLFNRVPSGKKQFSAEEKEAIDQRLRALGYIE